jgi:hypothetical protein
MHVYTGYTEIDEVNSIPQLFSQISSPILTCWIISTQAKGIRGTNGNISQTAPGWLLHHDMSLDGLSGSRRDTANQEKQCKERQHRKQQSQPAISC